MFIKLSTLQFGELKKKLYNAWRRVKKYLMHGEVYN